MAGAPDVSPYDEITSDELFDSFMDVVSGVERSFNGDGELNEELDIYDSPYENIGVINDSVSNNINNNLCIKRPVEKELSNCIPSNDSMHLPLLVKMSAEPIYELCGMKCSSPCDDTSRTDYGTSNVLPYLDKPLISDLDKPFIDIDNSENAYTDIYSVIPSRTHYESNSKCNIKLTGDGKVSNLNSTNTVCNISDNIPGYNPLYASVSMETRTKAIVSDEYAVVNKEHKVIKTNNDNNIIDNKIIRTTTPRGATGNNQTEIISNSTDDYVTIIEAETFRTATTESQDEPIITDIYAVVNKGNCGGSLEELHKKVHVLRQKSLSTSNSTYNIELSSSQSPTDNNSNNNSNSNNDNSNSSNNDNDDSNNNDDNDNNNNDNNNNNTNIGVASSVNIVSTKHDHGETSPLKRSNQGDISNNNINDSKDYITTESDYEFISDLKPHNTTSGVSTNNYSNIDDIRNYDSDPHSLELTFNAEQIAYGFSKSHVVNGSSIVPPSIKDQPTKDKRNFFGFGKWRSTDDTSKSSYQNICTDDLGKESKTFSPPSSRPHSSIPVLCSGYLFKQGGTGFTPKNWRLRWFELKKDNSLYYYKSEQDHIPNGAVILVKYEISRTVEVNKRFAFKLYKSGARTYYFAANSENEMKKWMTYLSDAARYACTDHVSIPECSLKNVSIPAVSITDPDHSGYISKQGSTHKTWKRRYCVLKYGCLFYYEDMNDKVAIGVFKLHRYTITTSDNVRYGFEAVPPVRKMRTYYFYSNTETDTRRWIDAMRRSISSFQ